MILYVYCWKKNEEKVKAKIFRLNKSNFTSNFVQADKYRVTQKLYDRKD